MNDRAAVSELAWEKMPARAAEAFGDALSQAVQYAELLCTLGVERGVFGPREPAQVWTRHLLPAAALGSLIPMHARVADLGSGAGLPGIPLAMSRPDLRIVLVEPMQRRVRFLGEVIAALALDVDVVRARGEDADVDVDVVVARAIAPLPRLLPMSLPLLRGGGTLLAVKGQAAEAEIAAAAQALSAASAQAALKKVGIGADETTVVTVQVPVQPVPSRPERRRRQRVKREGAR